MLCGEFSQRVPSCFEYSIPPCPPLLRPARACAALRPPALGDGGTCDFPSHTVGVQLETRRRVTRAKTTEEGWRERMG